MCRWIFYYGEEVCIAKLIFGAVHGLATMSEVRGGRDMRTLTRKNATLFQPKAHGAWLTSRVRYARAPVLPATVTARVPSLVPRRCPPDLPRKRTPFHTRTHTHVSFPHVSSFFF